MNRHTKKVVTRGTPLESASNAMILVHGRGATAESILGLADYLEVENFALLAPQASANTWYPYSFLAPVAQNEPGLSTALDVLTQLVQDILAAGLQTRDIFWLGFSQGACVTSEFLARNAAEYGGAFIYTGGVIGEKIDRSPYQGNFQQTPILLGCSDNDPHVPLHRAQDTVRIFTEMGAVVTERIYPNAPHTVREDEITRTNEILQERRKA